MSEGMKRLAPIFIFGAMLGWDGAQLASAMAKGERPLALLAGAGAILLVGVLAFFMTRSSSAKRRTEP